jgi:hypothetical protein
MKERVGRNQKRWEIGQLQICYKKQFIDGCMWDVVYHHPLRNREEPIDCQSKSVNLMMVLTTTVYNERIRAL